MPSSNLSTVNFKLGWKLFSFFSTMLISDSFINAKVSCTKQISNFNKLAANNLSTITVSCSVMMILAKTRLKHDPIETSPICSKIVLLKEKTFLVQQSFKSFLIVCFLMFVFNSFLLYIWSKITFIVLLKGTDVNSDSTSNGTNR